MNNWINTYASRLLIGSALLALPVLYMISQGTDVGHLIPQRHDVQNILTYLALVGFSYVNYTVLVPSWYLTRRYVRYGIVVTACLLAVALIPQRIEQWVFLKTPADPTVMGWARQLLWAENLFPSRPHQPSGYPPPVDHPGRPDSPPTEPNGRQPLDEIDGLFPATPLSIKLSIIFLLGIISAFAAISVQTGNRLRKVETDQLMAELNQLKAQIQPHFLFNTLNSIYALAIRKDDRTAETIVKLSEFMRYLIRDAQHDKVALAKDVQYISNYIDLQRARLRDSVIIEYTVDGDASRKQIAPLILFSYIENAFKHGVNPDEESIIRIRLHLQPDSVRLQVFNRKVRTSNLESSNGIGLPNASERLRLLYPAAHHLIIEDVPTHFSVDLTIALL